MTTTTTRRRRRRDRRRTTTTRTGRGRTFCPHVLFAVFCFHMGKMLLPTTELALDLSVFLVFFNIRIIR